MIDTHCHLTFPDYRDQVDQTLARAAKAGVTGAITISTTSHDAPNALALAKHHDRLWCSAGVHPLYADKGPHDFKALGFIARDPKCVAWGELGLDNHYDNPPREIQREVLAEQLAFIEKANQEVDLPVVLHCRKAFDDLIPILAKTSLDPSRFVFHCFTGDASDARKALDFGAHISFTGVLTYKNAPEVREAAALVPLDRMMVETDAPFLSPEPKRGVRPNEPAFVVHIAQRLAEIKEVPFEQLHEQLNENTRNFFGIDAR